MECGSPDATAPRPSSSLVVSISTVGSQSLEGRITLLCNDEPGESFPAENFDGNDVAIGTDMLAENSGDLFS